jgi:Haem-binding domain
MRKWIKRVGVAFIVALIAVQFVPVNRTNPPVEGKPVMSAELEPVVRRACYDCHSNETRWPWYTGIAPISFLIERDVQEGRRELNFSTWDRYDERRKARKLNEIVKEVERGTMPPWYYVPVHPDARLSPAEQKLIVRWVKPR